MVASKFLDNNENGYENDLSTLTLAEIDEKFIKPLNNSTQTQPTVMKNGETQTLDLSERRERDGFLRFTNKYYLDAKIIKEAIFPKTFEDYVWFARQKLHFPPCIASIILRCVDNREHPKNNERVILGKYFLVLWKNITFCFAL